MGGYQASFQFNLTDMLQSGQVALISFVSGFLGSLFASFVLRRGK